MPILHWIGKDKVVNHHHDVPFRLLKKNYTFNAETGAQKNSTNNRIIHGDNLDALKSLLPEFEGKIDCIYIDPPYNTGNEGWVYNDNVNDPKIKKWLGGVVGKEGEDLSRHDKWLCMMYPRLKLLHRLLAEDGVIFISIDDNEQANLKLLLDEICGLGNFVSNLIWEKNYSPRNDAKYFSSSHDFIIVYAKNKNLWKRNLFPRTEKQNKYYKYDDGDGRGLWRPDNVLVKTFSISGVFGIQNPNTKEVHYPQEGSCYRFTKDKADELLRENRLFFGKNGQGKPQLKRYLSEVIQGVVPQTIWQYEDVGHSQEGTTELQSIVNDNSFDTPKPSLLIQRIIQVATNKNAIVLDSFAGSGTTAHAVLKLNAEDGGNRRFICIEMMDYAETITAERVKRVIKGYGEEKKLVDGLGGGFDFYTVDAPLFLEDQNLNEDVGVKAIRDYVAYTENIPSKNRTEQNNTISPYTLGVNDDALYLFYYQKEVITTLDMAFIASLKIAELSRRPIHFIIYADKCVLEKEFMLKHSITFKRIPRDITRF